MKKPQQDIKVYVPVKVAFDEMGRMFPRAIVWEDGKIYEIDKVLGVRPTYAERAGGQGDRYTIRMHGKETYLFFEHSADFGSPIPGSWFVERRED